MKSNTEWLSVQRSSVPSFILTSIPSPVSLKNYSFVVVFMTLATTVRGNEYTDSEASSASRLPDY
jgi:hypothetical protein